MLRVRASATLVGMGHPADTYGPFPANVPEAGRWPHPAPDHQQVERERSGGLSDSPNRELPVRPVGPVPYNPVRLR